MKRIAPFFALLASGCLISPQEDVVKVALEVGVPPLSEPIGNLIAADEAWDAQDRFHLDAFPRFIRVAVEVEDYELATGSWPAHPASQAKSWSLDASGEHPFIELPVPAGPGRRISALAYDHQAAGVTFYQSRAPAIVDLIAGKTPGVALEMVPGKTGSASISVQCTDYAYRPYVKGWLSVVDAKAQLVLPPRALEGRPPGFVPLQWEGLPLGRPFRMQVLLQDELTGAYRLLELVYPTFTVIDPNGLLGVKAEIPCGA